MGCGSSKSVEVVVLKSSSKQHQTSNGNVSKAGFHPFLEFPTPQLLREANNQYKSLGQAPKWDENNELLPYPTVVTKRQVFNVTDFTSVDERACKTPSTYLRSSLQVLVDYLISPYKTELQRVRSIYRWITAQDLKPLPSNESHILPTTPYEYLCGIKGSTSSYNKLFEQMCRYAQIRSQPISGLLKGEKYEPGDDIVKDDSGSWMAVLINKSWHLIDAHWSSSHVSGDQSEEWELLDDNGSGVREFVKKVREVHYQYNEAYFLTNPEELIYSHFPTDNNEVWQLLARPVTLGEFKEMAYLKPAFFNLGLQLLSHRKCVIEAGSEGEVQIRFGVPIADKIRFMYRLWISAKGKDKSALFGRIKLERFAFMENFPLDVVSCRIAFPVAGKYKIEFFCNNGSDKSSGNSYQMVGAYVINASKPKEHVKEYPTNDLTIWGPGKNLIDVGLEPITHKEGLIELQNGETEVRFAAMKDVEVLADMHSNNKTKEDLKNFLFSRQENGQVIVNLKCPVAGDYALNIYAKERGKDGGFPHVCSYLVSTTQPAFDTTPFPDIPNGRLGPTDKMTGLGMKPISHPSAYFEASTLGEESIIFSTPKPCSVMAELKFRNKKETVMLENMVFLVQDKNRATFKVRFPESGKYLLTIYGKSKETAGESHPCVFNYLISVAKPMENCSPFPKSFNQWSKGCELFNPTSGALPANEVVPFAVKVEDAFDVVTISDSGVWTHFTKENDGIWRANINTGEAGSLKLSAKLEENVNSFSGLLVFQVVAKKEQEKQVVEQKKMIEKAKDDIEKEDQQRKQLEEQFEAIRKALLKAIHDCTIASLRDAIKAVETYKYVTRLKADYEKARELLSSLLRIEKLNRVILDLNHATMGEIRGYSSPPVQVHRVMIAALLLLGEDESLTQDWPSCQKLCVVIGPNGLLSRVKNFDLRALHAEIAARALQILQNYRLDDIQDISLGAGAFYAWVVGMSQERRAMNKDALLAPPADSKRQREIFQKKF